MLVKPGKKLCGEHDMIINDDATAGSRIPCPFDPKHTCDVNKLEKHLKKCRAKPQPLPVYASPSVNVPEGEEPIDPLSIASVSDDTLLEVIGRVRRVYAEQIDGKISTAILQHDSMKQEVTDPSFGPSVLKHLEQNSSLLAHLEQSDLLKPGISFVEFGSGRGQLTFWLTKASPAPTTCKFLLVDRASHRHKFDNRLKETDLDIQRFRVDIRDLVLEKLPVDDSVVGVSKHLCGAATDFALQCLANAKDKTFGVLIALCCHHRCSWAPYVGKEFLLDSGFAPKEFSLLCGLTSWATCGSGRPRSNRSSAAPEEIEENDDVGEEKKENGVDSENAVGEETNERYKRLQLDRSVREEIGRQCKRILDFGRVKFVEKSLGLETCLRYYTSLDISLENVVLIARKKS